MQLVTLLNHPINSNCSSADSFVFSLTITLFEKHDDFESSILVVLYFIYDSYNTLAIFFTAMLDNRGNSEDLNPILDFNEYVSSCSPIRMMLIPEVNIHKIFFCCYILKSKLKC